MRIVVRVSLGLVALFALALIALAVAIPRIAGRPEVREQIAQAAQRATGRELRFGALDAGVLPPRLIVDSPQLVAAQGEPPLRAKRIALRIALLPLLARAVVVDSLTVDGAELTLARTKDGIELPIELAAGEEAPSEESASVDLAVRGVRLTDTRITFVDRAVTPETTWALENVSARARGELASGGTLAFEADAKLASGGALSLSGEAVMDGPLTVKLALADFALAPASPYLPEGAKLEGSAALTAELSGPTEQLSGPIDLDLRGAGITFGDSFAKPAGETLRIKGALALGGEGVALRDGELQLRDLITPLAVETAPKTHVALARGSLDLSGWEAILPALAGLDLAGKLSFEALEIGLDPLSVHGTISLAGVSTPLAEGQRASVDLTLAGSGDAIRGKGPLTIAGQPIALELGIANLARDMALTLAVSANDLDSDGLAAAFGAPKGSVSGPLDLTAKLTAPLGGEASLVDSLSGPLTVGIAPGRMPGVSLFRGSIDALGGVASAAALTGKLGGDTLQKFYDDEFEKLGGSFALGGGKAHTEDLALLYRDYRVDLRGDVALADMALDLEGTLTIFEAIDQAIAGAATGTTAPQRAVKRELPLAHVGGTASDPRVSITPRSALAFTAAYLGGEKTQQLREKLDEKVGPGAGQVIDAIGSLFGGSNKKEEAK